VFDTYTPIVSWIIVRLLFVLFLVLKLDTQQVDYTTKFCQDPIHETVYVELPHGFEVPNMILHLRQSVYRLRQSPRNFYKHLREGLEDIGFIKYSYDDFLFTNDTVIVLFWVNDYILYSTHVGTIHEVINSLKDSCPLEKEEDMVGFLSIQLTRDGKGTIALT